MALVYRTWTLKDGTVRKRFYDDTEYREREKVKRQRKGFSRKALLVSRGKINQKRLDAIIEALYDTDGIELAEKIREQALEAEEMGGTLRLKTAFSIAAQGKIEKMFINAGYALEQAAADIGTTVADLVNLANWDGSVYTDPITKIKYRFTFRYNGSVWEQVQQQEQQQVVVA